jgi:hypothetical protein
MREAIELYLEDDNPPIAVDRISEIRELVVSRKDMSLR